MTLFDKLKSIKILKYLVVGGITFFLYYLFIWLFFNYLEYSYLTAISLSYFIAVSIHFLLNRNLTFNANKSDVKLHLIKYSFITLFNYSIQFSIIYVGYNLLSVNLYISCFIGIIVTIISGYFLMDIWVFKRS